MAILGLLDSGDRVSPRDGGPGIGVGGTDAGEQRGGGGVAGGRGGGGGKAGQRGRRAWAVDRPSVARIGGGGGCGGGVGVGGSEGQEGLGGLDGLHPRAALRPVRRLRRAAPAGSDEGGGGKPERGRASQSVA